MTKVTKYDISYQNEREDTMNKRVIPKIPNLKNVLPRVLEAIKDKDHLRGAQRLKEIGIDLLNEETEWELATKVRLMVMSQATSPSTGITGSSGLLERFMADQLNHWNELEIDLSRRKYCVSLLMLTSLTLQEISEVSGVSYGVIKKWRIEKQFKRQVMENISQFLRGFEDYATQFPDDRDKRIYSDSRLYSQFLKKNMLESSFKIAEEKPTTVLHLFSIIHSFLRFYPSRDDAKLGRKMEFAYFNRHDELLQKYNAFLVKQALAILQRASMTKEQKVTVVECLKQVAKFLGE